jgi:hypothetical protein
MTTPRRPFDTDGRDPLWDPRDDTAYLETPERAAARGPRVPVALVVLVLALVGSVAYVLYVITVRDQSQIPLMASGAAVLGVVFIGLSLFGLTATWRAGVDARGGRAIALGCLGGIAAMIGAGALAVAIILLLMSRG